MIPASDVSPVRDGRAPTSAKGETVRALALFVIVLSISTVPATVAIGIPFVLLVLALPARRVGALILAAVIAFITTGGSAQAPGTWYLERGWAVLAGGWFLASTVRWPAARVLDRCLVAVAGAAATGAAWFMVRPGAWQVVDFGIAERMRRTTGVTLDALRALRGGDAIPPEMVAAVQATADAQHLLFPALLGLGTMAALGFAWWMYVRTGLGARGALGRVQEFRFNDHLVWLFIGGLVLLAAGAGTGEAWSRTGSNAVVFMGGLYALRGAAVLLFVNGGISMIGMVAVALAMTFLAPILVAGALIIGLGDTWWDLRARFARSD